MSPPEIGGSILLGVRLLALLIALMVNIDDSLVGTTEERMEDETSPPLMVDVLLLL